MQLMGCRCVRVTSGQGVQNPISLRMSSVNGLFVEGIGDGAEGEALFCLGTRVGEYAGGTD